MKRSLIQKISRRQFFSQLALGSSSGLLLATEAIAQPQGFLAKLAASATGNASIESQNTAFKPNLFLSIPSRGPIELVCHRSEMGQGIRTGIAMLLAEELDVKLDNITLRQAPGDAAYGDQNTDGSRSIRMNWDRLRQFAATARVMLVEAAAEKLQVPAKTLTTSEGRVWHEATKRSLSYQELAAAAANLDVPKEVSLKSRDQYKLIGKEVAAVDRFLFTKGAAVYGLDVKRPQMLYAALRRSPTLSGQLRSVSDQKAKAMTGVLQVVELEAMPQPVNTNASVAVIATDTWTAMQAANALELRWEAGPYAKVSDSSYRKKLETVGLSPNLSVAMKEGKLDRSKKPAKTISRVYTNPFLVHAPMEPMVATAEMVPGGGAKIWAPTQDPQRLQSAAAKFLGVDASKVEIHVTFLGGGFGRKSQPDFGMEALALARKVNKPVQLVWSREDEIKHGFYHAAAWQKIEADLDKNGELQSWTHDSIFPTVLSVFQKNADTPHKFELGMGATNMPYRSKFKQVRSGAVDAPVRVGWLRSVCNLFHATAVNCFVDELAEELKKDPIAYRLQLLGEGQMIGEQDTGRLINVIKQCRKVADWDKRKAAGAKLGFACHHSFGSYVAVVAEVQQQDDRLRVARMDVVADCGQIVHRDAVMAQFEGSVVFGLSAALYGNITLKNGAVEQSNFDDYNVLRMDRMPEVHVSLVDSTEKPEGVGEPGTPPVVPAVMSAIFAQTGKRVRDLPLAKYVKV